jgi:hypothetical protein
VHKYLREPKRHLQTSGGTLPTRSLEDEPSAPDGLPAPSSAFQDPPQLRLRNSCRINVPADLHGPDMEKKK